MSHRLQTADRPALRALGAGLALWVASSSAGAQTAPSSHWGALMFPDMEPASRVGFQILAFTEFGKDTTEAGLPVGRAECAAVRGDSASTPCGARDRYNDIDETVGLNLLTYSLTRPLQRYKTRGSNLLYTHLVSVGWINDWITESYQNDAIHELANLQSIPREDRACHEQPSWSYLSCLVLSYSGALNYRFYAFDNDAIGVRLQPTPLFGGAGFVVSTLENDLYGQFGIRDFDLTGPLGPSFARQLYVTLSAMVRAGVLYPGVSSKLGHGFPNLASHYVSAQASLGLHVARYAWPVSLELGAMGTTGQFLSRDRTRVAGRPVESEALAPALTQQFWSLRLEIGAFGFETFNDQLGGTDKGPSYGAMITYSLSQGEWSWAEFSDAAEYWSSEDD